MANIHNRNNQHSFAQTPAVNMSRSKFDRSFTVKDTFDFDDLVPVFVDEVLPGDTANVNVAAFGRLSTPIFPIMDNMYLDFFFFFVPNRLVWDNWEQFIAQSDLGTLLIPTTTTLAGTGEPIGGLPDKFGIPTKVPGLEVNALPFRAYNLIWNEWFRDQNMQPIEAYSPKDDGPDNMLYYRVLNQRGKRHDYFTSVLVSPQKGSSVTIPFGTGQFPVYGPTVTATNGQLMQGWDTTAAVPAYGPWTKESGVNTLSVDVGPDANWSTTGHKQAHIGLATVGQYAAAGANYSPPYGLITPDTVGTINELRQAFQLQSMLELDNRGGTRYVELLLAHFNVVSPDFRLQRPEYLGGGEARLNVQPVAQTTPAAAPTTKDAKGSLAAFGTFSTGGKIGFTKSFVEHGYVIGMVAARADITYQQGLERFWSRQTRFDFFWPKLQELGDQAVLNKEIYSQGTVDPTADAEPFGYQERYADYRYKPSQIHGLFRSNETDSLDAWHLAEDFASLPQIDVNFIQSQTPIDRAVAVPSEPDIIADFWFQYKHARPMLTYSVPMSLGRF